MIYITKFGVIRTAISHGRGRASGGPKAHMLAHTWKHHT